MDRGLRENKFAKLTRDRQLTESANHGSGIGLTGPKRRALIGICMTHELCTVPGLKVNRAAIRIHTAAMTERMQPIDRPPKPGPG